jgi:hypothetical protein
MHCLSNNITYAKIRSHYGLIMMSLIFYLNFTHGTEGIKVVSYGAFSAVPLSKLITDSRDNQLAIHQRRRVSL